MTTSNPDSLWVAQASEEYEEVDEPDDAIKRVPSNNFRKSSIRRPNEQSSLLTKAIMGYSDEDAQASHHEVVRPVLSNTQRRRSITSNISIASTADLTSDTGLTSPSRPSTPSPPLPEIAFLRLDRDPHLDSVSSSLLGAAVRQHLQPTAPQDAPRKRSIQFACGKPAVQEPLRPQPMVKTPSAQEAPRRPCIRFACPARPASTQNTPPRPTNISMGQALDNGKPESDATPKKSSTLSIPAPVSPRQPNDRRPSASRPAFIRATSTELAADGSHFHEFASATAREDDWIRREDPAGKKLTINDTLVKENNFRRLATEAEEEDELENENDEAALDDEEDDEDEDDAEDEEDDDEDDEDEDDEYEDDSDGYHTDEETGFAESDEEDDSDEAMAMWTPSQKSAVHTGSPSQLRRPSLHEQHSDSSTAAKSSHATPRHTKSRRIKSAANAADLPDSTDFVCGTLDEDKPLEEAYLERMAARRNEKLRVIPQDIDPSFPTSDFENEDEEEIFNPVHHDSDEEDWLHGEMEDIHHERDRPRRRRKSEHASPKRYRSPPPAKRHRSPPPPRTRARSPKLLFDRHSPRKARSPPPQRKNATTPLGSPRCGQVEFNLAGRPGLTHTKSLPRAGMAFLRIKQTRQNQVKIQHSDVHVRGAMDIVKGLEKKRQRRKEKFQQKYCDRARRGQIPERKPLPGRGAVRMRELGLLMAGKKDPGNYVLSV